MPISIVEDIKPVSELKTNTKEIFNQLHTTKRPIIITVNGKPDVVLIDANEYETQLKIMNLKILLEEAEDDIRNNRIRPIDDFFREFDKR